MITGELKNKIDGLWDIFAAGGLVNPLEVIEQDLIPAWHEISLVKEPSSD